MGVARRKIREKESFKTDIANLAEKYYEEGYDDGVEDTRADLKAAISDGLRHGSGECGRQLRGYRKASIT